MVEKFENVPSRGRSDSQIFATPPRSMVGLLRKNFEFLPSRGHIDGPMGGPLGRRMARH
jgi:hypothetical protein